MDGVWVDGVWVDEVWVDGGEAERWLSESVLSSIRK